MFDLSSLLGVVGPVTVAEGHFKVVIDPATKKAEVIIDNEKVGPFPLQPVREDLDIGALAHIVTSGLGSLIAKVLGQKPTVTNTPTP